MAIKFTFWSPKTLNNFPEIPGVWRIPSPTTAIRDKSCSIFIESINLFSSSKVNSSFNNVSAKPTSFGWMAKQIECSLKT